MDRLRRDVILIRLIEALRDKGSWCGETHVQKATYFLQELVGAQTGFDFILYKHGPFSFDLSDELAAMRSDRLVTLRVQDSRYGPSILPEPAANVLKQRFPKTLRDYEHRVALVAEKFGNKRVVELERLATALYVLRDLGDTTDVKKCVDRIHALKPHISKEDAAGALQMVQAWSQETKDLTSTPENRTLR
jgi:hypothetical protein